MSESLAEFELLEERGSRPRRLVTVDPAGLAAIRETAGAIRSMIGDRADTVREAG